MMTSGCYLTGLSPHNTKKNKEETAVHLKKYVIAAVLLQLSFKCLLIACRSNFLHTACTVPKHCTKH